MAKVSSIFLLNSSGLKEEEDDEDEEEDEFEQVSYFRSKMQNKVAPMSYMHYKSMLREGINKNGGDGLRRTQSSRRTPQTNQKAFQDKYPAFNDTSNSLRSKPAGLEPLDKQRKRSLSNPVSMSSPRSSNYSLNDNISSLSLNKRSNTFVLPSQNISPKVNLPHGNRLPRNIGSPPQNVRVGKIRSSGSSLNGVKQVGSPNSVRSNRSLNSAKSTKSPKSHKNSVESQQKQNILQTVQESPSSRWDRLIERIPFSKKRRRQPQIPTKQRKDSTKEDNSLGIGKKEVKGCFYKYLDLIGILLPVCMQDGPFFILRFVLISHYQVVTEMIYLLTIKNALVIIVQIYRILLMYCSEPKKEETDFDDPSLRVRAAMDTNQKLSGRNKKASIAVIALNRMHNRLFGNRQPPGNDNFGEQRPYTEKGRTDGDTLIEMGT